MKTTLGNSMFSWIKAMLLRELTSWESIDENAVEILKQEFGCQKNENAWERLVAEFYVTCYI